MGLSCGLNLEVLSSMGYALISASRIYIASLVIDVKSSVMHGITSIDIYRSPYAHGLHAPSLLIRAIRIRCKSLATFLLGSETLPSLVVKLCLSPQMRDVGCNLSTSSDLGECRVSTKRVNSKMRGDAHGAGDPPGVLRDELPVCHGLLMMMTC
jgi:hypothetical protein